ncbi:hypothetical protein [Methylobacterium gnaphalii]|uniref:Lipoprotein n=1 Tax=Methylobacterium gnaphalii TaxID=1010610 RepID=A0A512JI29_9HYPH|nr:hypothetical protein [Methylobacterium gnaphalii]GEP09615.1 hypothetical protein MGN01_14600 [Methylobacterium gnaphalii]GJD67798.1 hypothetical protein MMMDOFMJ_0715 [Methylobacterium gnaphalii]GLS48592.1 hypothetical protein GCM10007885_14360 [Methylobacterium gnaphalii]
MNTIRLALLGGLMLASPAIAQPATAPGAGQPASRPVTGGQNNTGNDRDAVVPRGSTGADTYQSNSSAAGNAAQPERAVPQGSGGASGSGSSQ